MFSRIKKYIYFVHIPKNAGNSIRQACMAQNIKVVSHNIRKRNKRLLAAHRRNNDLHAFCISRNPYDRIVSAYNYLLNDGKNKTKEDNIERDIFLKPYADFTDFIKNGLAHAAKNQLHFLPQVFWIKNHNGEPEVETVLKMENLQDELNAFCHQMGLPPQKLAITNTSPRNNSWEEYYTPETQKIVADVYHDDFDFFDYEK